MLPIMAEEGRAVKFLLCTASIIENFVCTGCMLFCKIYAIIYK